MAKWRVNYIPHCKVSYWLTGSPLIYDVHVIFQNIGFQSTIICGSKDLGSVNQYFNIRSID